MANRAQPSPVRGGSQSSRDNGSASAGVASSDIASSRGLGVLGIGLVMEEAGKGARLVFRYPASPPPFFSDGSDASNVEGETNGRHHGREKSRRRSRSPKSAPSKSKRDVRPSSTGSSTDESSHPTGDSIDLFFDLPARVISKLFRPKRPLCGQPLTLNVSGTTFCCRAELFDSQPSTIGGGEGSNHPLVLFSVIVALAPLGPRGEVDALGSQYPAQRPPDLGATNADGSHLHSTSTSVRSDQAFTTIMCVHRNLARLCRVLTREEFRCRYVSRQCSMLLQIRADYESTAGPDGRSIAADGDGSAASGDAGSTKKNDSNSSGHPPLSPKTTSKGKNPPLMPPPTSKAKETKKSNSSTSTDDEVAGSQMSRTRRREYVQNLIEVMLASQPPASLTNPDHDSDFDGREQHGNLARELAQAFHWLSSPSTNQTPFSCVTSQEGVVYINRHIAVPLEPLDNNNSVMHRPTGMPGRHTRVQPYHTLLFPESSASDILDGLTDTVNGMTASPSTSQSLRRLLPHIQPRKSILEAAWDSGLPPPQAMEAARWLVHSSICVAAMPVVRKNRYVCVEGVVPKMSSFALSFWQTFGVRSHNCKFYWGRGAASSLSDEGKGDGVHRRRTVTSGVPNIFVVVSALTTKTADGSTAPAPPTLGDAIDSLSGIEVPSRDDLSPHYQDNDGFQRLSARSLSASGLSLTSDSGGSTKPIRLDVASSRGLSPGASLEAKAASEQIYSMAAWLVANRIISEVKDFLVALKSPEESKIGGQSEAAATMTPDDALYEELLQSKCMDGTMSVPYICFRFGLDRFRMEKFTSWGQRTNKVGIISRMACPSDDGGGP